MIVFSHSHFFIIASPDLSRRCNLSGFAWGENIGWINFNSADLYGYGILACKVNFTDLGNFVDDWLKSSPALPGDLSNSNNVDFIDYGIFADYWLTYCPDNWPLK